MDFVDRVSALQEYQRDSQKMLKNYKKEIIASLVDKWKADETRSDPIAYYRPDGDMEFISELSKEFQTQMAGQSTGVFFGGSMEAGGPLVLVGDPQMVAKVSESLIVAIGRDSIKGGGKNGRFQAKVSSWKSLRDNSRSLDFRIQNFS